MVAFGPKYLKLAYQAADSVTRHNPGIEVDLFTDADSERGPFNRVHILDDVWVRSKVDAMLQSRFEKTLYLDVDLLVLAELGEIFEILDKFDMAAAHDPNRNSFAARRPNLEIIANSFPQVNSGVVAFRKSELVNDFLEKWKTEIKAQGIGKDQPSLRELLWNENIRLAVLPPEYNVWDLSMIDYMKPASHTAPRILHSNVFREAPEPDTTEDTLNHYLGKARAFKIRLLLAADETLAQRAGRTAWLPTRKQRNHLKLLYAFARVTRLRKTLIEPFLRARFVSRGSV
jgi:lipopolysaccharide biosynthesis glycosyltransferase